MEMTRNFGDRLLEAIRRKKTPVCVGLDPLPERFPEVLRVSAAEPRTSVRATPPSESASAAANALVAYGRGVIDAVAPLVPAIKINIAFFEPFGPDGIAAYQTLIASAHRAGLIVIGDVKRADIGHTSAQYAKATLDGPEDDIAIADAVTVNPYFGWDGVGPFIDAARVSGRGVFVLVQTSNESAARVQGLTLADGSILCHSVAHMVEAWASAEGLVGDRGYSCVGAVVSPRDLESTIRIRALMPHCIFLVPGFGAQGRTAEEVARCFKSDGTGAIVAASRSVIYAYEESRFHEHAADWKRCIAEACKEFIADVRRVVPLSR